MSTLKRHLWWIFLVATLSACSQTHYVNSGLQVGGVGTPFPFPTVSATGTPPPSSNYSSYLLATNDNGQMVTNDRGGTWFKYVNKWADPLSELDTTTGIWKPIQVGYYLVTASVAFAPPQSSYDAQGNFIPGTWPPNSYCQITISRNDGAVLHSVVQPVTGTLLCQAEATLAIAMRAQDALGFNAIVSTAEPSVSLIQLGQRVPRNEYTVLSIARFGQ